MEFGLDDHHFLAPHLKREKQRRETDVDSQALIELVFFLPKAHLSFSPMYYEELEPFVITGLFSGAVLLNWICLRTKILYQTQ